MSLQYDIVVVGSGAAGLTAAAIASSEGLKTLLIEKNATLGGTTALSGGTVWVPNNPIAKQHGICDTEVKAIGYIEAAIGPDESEYIRSTATHRKEYLNKAPKLIEYLQKKNVKWTLSEYPDYQPRLKGALPAGGRTLNPRIFDANKLGTWKHYLDIPSPGCNIKSFEEIRLHTISQISRQECPESDHTDTSKTSNVTMGRSLIAQLLYVCKLSNRVTIMTETKFADLLLEESQEIGVELVKGSGKRLKIQSKAVFLAVAGFARNQSMREKYQQKSVSVDWTLAQSNGDDGSVLRLMMSKGADTGLLQETWGIPTMKDPLDGRLFPAPFVLSKPHCVLVSQHDGCRFCSEARPYGDYNKDAHASVPSWLILDSVYLEKYTLGSLDCREDGHVDMAVQRGHLKRSSSLLGLAEQLKINSASLKKTIKEWNVMCEEGKDTIFGKGEDEYQRFIGDETMKPNPNMGTVEAPPFYAAQVFPGMLGLKVDF
ncbi:hypothetical protein TrVFT333_006437 [Trichoderma virens FT-333]|nr:hypothetical protein TrVFT333_006437 [Trichoderma virens FT-333]